MESLHKTFKNKNPLLTSNKLLKLTRTYKDFSSAKIPRYVVLLKFQLNVTPTEKKK